MQLYDVDPAKSHTALMRYLILHFFLSLSTHTTFHSQSSLTLAFPDTAEVVFGNFVASPLATMGA